LTAKSGMPACPDSGRSIFAAGHLGELTQLITPDLVDQVLQATRRVEKRVRKLPSRVMVYFVLAMTLFPREGYRGVWASLVAGMRGAVCDPSAAALRQARRRIGPEPLGLLFDQLKGCTATTETIGAWWRGLRLVAWDGTTLEVADSPANAAYFGYYRARRASTYPLVRLTALVECGTRALVDAVTGPVADGEKSQARRLCAALRPGMLHLADRGFDGLDLMRQAAGTGAELLWRINTGRILPAVEALDDGSWLSMVSTPTGRNQLVRWVDRDRRCGVAPQVHGVAVRVIEADVTVTDQTTGTSRTSRLRLVTTLLDHQRYPARELAALYHQRWEIETAYYGLKVTLLGAGTVLRSHHPRDVLQELFALFIVFQAARRTATDAATAAGIDPDRISLTVTLRTARHTVITADSAPDAEPGTTPRITTATLNPRNLGPNHRRPRILPRHVKRTLSKFAYNETRNDKPLQRATTTITVTPHPSP
jgi:hypothetical protein